MHNISVENFRYDNQNIYQFYCTYTAVANIRLHDGAKFNLNGNFINNGILYNPALV